MRFRSGRRALRRLDLGGNRLRDVSVLGDLPNLVWLRVSGNPADFSPLARPTALRWLVLEAGVPLIETTQGKASGTP